MDNMRETFMSEIEIPSRLDEVISESIRCVYAEKRMQTKRRVRVAGFATAFVFACGVALCFANPTLAKKLPLIGRIFERMDGKTSYEVDLQEDASALLDNQELESLESHEALESPYVCESNQLTISITEAAYDKAAIYLGVSIQNEEEFPEGFMEQPDYMESAKFLFLDADVKIRDKDRNLIHSLSGLELEGSFLDSHTYMGICQIELSQLRYFPDVQELSAAGIRLEDYYSQETEDDSQAFQNATFQYYCAIQDSFPNAGQRIPLPDACAVELFIQNVHGEDISNEQPTAIAGQDGQIVDGAISNWVVYEGEWSYSFDVTLDEDSYETVEVNELDDDGYGITQVTRTKHAVFAETRLRGLGVNSLVVICDAQGDLLGAAGSYMETYSIEGRDTSKVYVFVCDENQYLSELKGYYCESGYEERRKTKTFAAYLSEHAEYEAVVEFENR